MNNPLVAALRDFQLIVGICPCCGEPYRLSDAKVYYARKPATTVFDRLKAEDARLDAATTLLEDNREGLRKKSLARGRKQRAAQLQRYVPKLTELGYSLEDTQCLFDPIDFVVFAGIREKKAREIALLDGIAHTKRRASLQTSLESAIKRGNVAWCVARIGDTGSIRCSS